MTSRRWGAAPEPEWVLMYRNGLGRGQIAEQSGAPTRTVGYHLAVARKLQPGLQAEHHEAARRKQRRVTRKSLERMAELVALVQGSGRYPSTKSIAVDERALAAWLNRRRKEARAGTLLPALRDGLNVLPGWLDVTRAANDEARWQERLAGLVAYRRSGQDWPRHKATIEGLEHELGVWLHTQRYKARRGDLAPAKIGALDARAPGWQEGRNRGRKSLGLPAIGPLCPGLD